MIHIAADPGGDGALAIIGGGTLTHLVGLTDDPADTWAVLSSLVLPEPPTSIYVEQQSMRAGERNPTAIGKLLRSTGNVELALIARWTDTPITYVRPVVWQTAMGCRGRGMDYNDRKRAGRDVAQSLYPDPPRRITIANGDAVCIAHYATLCHADTH